MGKINTNNYPNRPVSDYQDDDMFILQDNGGETYTTNVGDIKNLADSRIKLEGVQVNGSDLPISGKKVNVDISGKTDLSVIAYTFNSEMGYFKGAYVTYNGKLYEFIQEHTGAWNPSHVREIKATGRYVRAGNGGYNNGDRATCEGYMTKASGNYSHAEGRETQAVGECTHAEGRGTIANSIYQHVEGKYNVADNESKYIHIIGNGIDDNNRSNAMTLDWDGNLEVSGDVENGNGEKISDKTDKVADATPGHLAGLDSNGNLTDSGVSPTEDVTVEGNPVTFDSPFEQDAKNVVVSVKPIQDLHGYDHPWPAGGGKNKFKTDFTATSLYDISFTPNEDGSITINGTAINAGSIKIGSFDFVSGTTYKLTGSVAPTSGEIEIYDSTNHISSKNGTEGTWTPSENITSEIRVWFKNGSVINNVKIYPMIRLSSETDATFAPYSNICPISGTDEVEIGVSDGESEPTTTTIPLPSTLYDADVDVTEGSGDSRFKLIDLGSLDYQYASGYNLFYAPVFDSKYSGNGSLVGYDCVCSCYTSAGNKAWTNFANNDINIGSDTTGGHKPCVNIRDNRYTDVDEFKAAVTGQKICYELATPTTLSITPTDVELLEGTNVVSTNGEKVAVTYGRSLWQDIDDLKTDTEGKLDKSNVADVEGDTASKAYSVNDFMLRSDGFYKVTQPIAQNASITASNTTKTTVGEVLTALLNA